MGYRCHWLATRGRDLQDVLDRLKLKVVGELVEPVYDPGLYALEVGDWVVVIGDGTDHMNDVKRAQGLRLSEAGIALYLSLDDSAMAFELVMFDDARALWTVIYDGSDGVTAPTFEGSIPWDVRTLHARLEKEQARAGGPKAEVDHIYGLGPTYARSVTGFRHDESLGSGDHVPVWQLRAL